MSPRRGTWIWDMFINRPLHHCCLTLQGEFWFLGLNHATKLSFWHQRTSFAHFFQINWTGPVLMPKALFYPIRIPAQSTKSSVLWHLSLKAWRVDLQICPTLRILIICKGFKMCTRVKLHMLAFPDHKISHDPDVISCKQVHQPQIVGFERWASEQINGVWRGVEGSSGRWSVQPLSTGVKLD